MTTTTAVTAQQLGQLADLDPSFFSKHRDDLPPSFPLHVQTVGRPQRCYSIDDVAQLVAQRTSHLSETVCRLQLALRMHTSQHRIISVEGRHHVVYDHEPLQDLDPEIAQAVLEQIHADHDRIDESRRTRHQPVTGEQP
ncbi:hypothetical protein FGL97_09045 [Pseudomonas putida]|uniref:hypothetical protein n=1 Tax=Pseudomonas putida TaxID=303 RepID=UPI00159DA2DD|nr:hypothetical protein [Pseudomonas putida]NVN63369.1 hypothetical protein [Pseudomonas putida]NVN68362.1 hypothetical protein [Pseudomonas putida]